MTRSLLSLLILLSISVPSTAERVVRIVDVDGQPVEHFEMMLHTANHGFYRWAGGRDGIFHSRFPVDIYGEAAIDVIVRAEDYASVFLRLSGKDKLALLDGGTELKLSRGREVRLVVVPPEGVTLPADLLPQVYFADLARSVESMSQSNNQSSEQSDFNMLGIQPIADKLGEYVMRVADDQGAVYGSHSSPRSHELQSRPFTVKDFTDGEMKLAIGRPSSITAKLTWGNADQDSLPFHSVTYHLGRQIHPGGNGYSLVASGDRTLDDTSFHANELSPGHYMLTLRTKSKIESDADSDEVNIGSFSDRWTFDVVSGQHIECVSTYLPFNAEVYRGEQTARIKIIDINGQLAAGKTLAISYFDGHYGQLDVFEGKIPAGGVVAVTNITDKALDDIPFGPYTASVDGEGVGYFRVVASDKPQDFTFHLIPKVGDAAPDIELVDLDTKAPLRLSELRGRFVYLEFWETACGPCQPEQEKLNKFVGTNREKWQKDVVVISLATDAEQQIIIDHVRRKAGISCVIIGVSTTAVITSPMP